MLMYFRRKTADYFRSNFSSIQTLILRFGYLCLNYTLAITTATMHSVQTWLHEAWLMAEKYFHRSLIRCKKIVWRYLETVKQEEGIVQKPFLRSDKNLYLKRRIQPKIVETGSKNAKCTSGGEQLYAWSIRTQGHSAKPEPTRKMKMQYSFVVALIIQFGGTSRK